MNRFHLHILTSHDVTALKYGSIVVISRFVRIEFCSRGLLVMHVYYDISKTLTGVIVAMQQDVRISCSEIVRPKFLHHSRHGSYYRSTMMPDWTIHFIRGNMRGLLQKYTRLFTSLQVFVLGRWYLSWLASLTSCPCGWSSVEHCFGAHAGTR